MFTEHRETFALYLMVYYIIKDTVNRDRDEEPEGEMHRCGGRVLRAGVSILWRLCALVFSIGMCIWGFYGGLIM